MDQTPAVRTRAEAEAKARKIVERWAKTAYLTGWIPGAALALTAADAVMIRQVAAAFGIEVFDMDSVKAHLGGLLASGVGAGVASEVVGTIPLIGWIAKSAVLGLKAEGLGKGIIDYFRARSPLPE
jgi:uncharacterized protein (DUF697 family)